VDSLYIEADLTTGHHAQARHIGSQVARLAARGGYDVVSSNSRDPETMTGLCMSLLGALRSALRTRAELALENLALRQQLANLRHTSGRPRVRMADRAFGLLLSRLWSRWADVLVIVKPDTVKDHG
jgi:hypothetical protein